MIQAAVFLNTIRAMRKGEKVEGSTMRRPASGAIALVLVLATAACQRPTQVLPPAPVFEIEQGGEALTSDSASNGADANDGDSDTLAVADNGGVVPGSVEDFLRYAGTDKVYFAYDSAELTTDGQNTLARQAEWLLKYPAVRPSLEGHADERGTREYNFALGERRAAAMKFYLNVRGVANERMTTTSLGKERPAVAGSDEQSWSENRRGETVLIGAVGQN